MNLPLLFDHIYRVVDDNTFDELKVLSRIFPVSSHEKKNTNYGHWEGIYITARDGSYLEFIRKDHDWNEQFISVATSSFIQQNNLFNKICQIYPQHKYNLLKINTPAGEPWMHTTMMESPIKNIYFYAIEYQTQQLKKRTQRGKNKNNWAISMDSIEFDASQEQFDKIPLLVDWFASNVVIKNDKAEIQLTKPDGTKFVMIANLNRNTKRNTRFIFKGTYDEDLMNKVAVPDNLKHISLTFKSGIYTLERK